MKAERTGAWTWYSVRDGEKTYTACEMYDENADSVSYEINNPDDDTEEITDGLVDRIVKAIEENLDGLE